MEDPVRTYGMREFAALTGVTIRALRHYDRLGLLTPRRGDNRYRVYVESDRARLERILALKGIGVPLSDVARLLVADAHELAAALARYRQLIEVKTHRLELTLRILVDVESRLRTDGAIDAVSWRRLIEVSDMEQEEADWRDAFAELQRIAEARRSELSAASKLEMGTEFGCLVADVQRALAGDPTSESGRALARRWLTLLRRLYGADVPLEVFITAGRHTADWQAESATPAFGKWPGFAFLAEALAANSNIA